MTVNKSRFLSARFGHDWDPTCMKMDETLYRYKLWDFLIFNFFLFI